MIRNLLAGGLALVAGLSAALAAAAQDLDRETAGRLDHDIAAIVKATEIPSASIAIVRDGRLVYAKAYGQAAPERGVEATPQIRYRCLAQAASTACSLDAGR